jgi:hypothetical protein
MLRNPLCGACSAVFAAALPLLAFASGAAPTHLKHAPPPPGPHAPTTRQHSEFVVETNKLGQVTRATKVTRSSDSAFNAMTYGNALQAFIRTPDGKAIAGTYRLTYDYNPRTKNVHRGVELIKMGGVNPNAEGAVNVEAAKLRAEQHQVQAAAAEASALPDLHHLTSHHH